MAVAVVVSNWSFKQNPNFKLNPSQFYNRKHHFSAITTTIIIRRPCLAHDSSGNSDKMGGAHDDESDTVGVKVALSMLKFYKREISPLMPNSCRYVPTCSEYSMIAYKKYGVVKGTVLTAWRLCRCNPLGGSGFDPPRWFDEAAGPEQ